MVGLNIQLNEKENRVVQVYKILHPNVKSKEQAIKEIIMIYNKERDGLVL